MQIEVITRQELQQLHQKIDVLQATISSLLTTGLPPAKEPKTGMLTRAETARKYRITLSTLDKYTRQGRIKGYRIGGRILYKIAEIDQNLEAVNDGKYRRQK